MTTLAADAPVDEVAAARRATTVAFVALGLLWSSWATRIPQVREQLHLSAGALGLLLLTAAAGSLLALPCSGVVVHRLGSRRGAAIFSLTCAAGFVVAGTGYLAGSPLVGLGLFVAGFSTGMWDVSMNVQGATVERRLGRAIMPRFHAGYSVGTVAAALLGAAMVAGDVPVPVHLVLVAAVVAVAVPLWCRAFVSDVDEQEAAEPRGNALRHWLERRTLLIGVLVLAFTLAEGTANDWINVSFVDDYDTAAVVGTLALAVFLAAMTAARWYGTRALDRHGRVVTMRVLSVAAVVGIALFGFGIATPVAFVGVLLWGVGASLAFPVGMSAAADQPAAAAGRVGVVASVGYGAFLTGPPLIGFLGDAVTVRHALLSVAVVVALASLAVGQLRPLPATEKP